MRLKCKNCKVLFDTNYPMIFCSPECNLEAMEKLKGNSKVAKCLVCKTEFKPPQKKSSCCSKKCYQKHWYHQNKKVEKKRCKECKKLYLPKRKNQAYCSDNCRKQKRVKALKKVCVYCQNPFVASNLKQAYCSKRCVEDKRNQVGRTKRASRNLKRKKCLCCQTFFNTVKDESLCNGCYSQAKNNIENYVPSSPNCLICKAAIELPQRKFCSNRCASIAENVANQNDIDKRLIMSIRYKLIHILGKQPLPKKKIIALLGCEVSQLKKHLESQFKEGLYWSNYGVKWGMSLQTDSNKIDHKNIVIRLLTHS